MFGSTGQTDCANCPQNSNPAKGRFCQYWYEGDHLGRQLNEKCVQTGEVRTIEGCFFKVVPKLLFDIYVRVDSATAEVSEMRTENNQEAVQAVQVMGALVGRLASHIEHKQLDHDSDPH